MASYIINKAFGQETIHDNTCFLEATSGNTGIALSMMAARLGKQVKIIMPCNMSQERKQMMKIFGAEIIEVGPNCFKEAIELRDSMLEENDNFWSPKQFSNPLNTKCHREITGPEIAIDALPLFKNENPSQHFEAFVHGSGTGGTLMGIWEYFTYDINLESFFDKPKKIKFVLTTPAESAENHGIQGINDGADFLLDKSVLDQEIKIETEAAIETMKELSKTKGLLVGISSAANLLAARKWVKENPDSGSVITMFCDRGERYLQS